MGALSSVVVVGASLTGINAARALRRGGYDGALTLVGAERHRPYDRPSLSKQVLAGAWEPEIVFISAGFDAMHGDPLGGFTLEPDHFADLTLRLRERFPGAPLVGLLEGGYIPARLAEGVAAHVRALA